MTKERLKEIARVGVRQVLHDMEDQIAEVFAEFPEMFLSKTPPVLARPELKNGHAGPLLLPGTVVVAPKKKKSAAKYYGPAETARRRKFSGELLAMIAKYQKPMPLDEIKRQIPEFDARTLPALSRRGYVKKSAKGYLRTAKEFIVDKNAAARVARQLRA